MRPSGLSSATPSSRCSERSGTAAVRSPSDNAIIGVSSVSARRNSTPVRL